jgi:small subunit ribosomal protein S17
MAKTITGVVSSKKTDKTIVVTEHVRLTHPLYRKQYTVTKKFMAHDEKNEAKEGDKVVIGETRPLSARKHHQLIRVVEKAGVKHVEETPEVVAPKEKLNVEKADADAKRPTRSANTRTATGSAPEKA